MAELFSGPLMSIALVILAGIALRYALWMGREREPDTGGRAHDLETRNQELAAALERSQAKQRELQADSQRISEDYQSLRDALDAREAVVAGPVAEADLDELTAEWSQKVEQIETDKSQLSAELAATQTRLAETEGRSAALVGQLDELRSKLRRQQEDRRGLMVTCDQLQDNHQSTLEQRDQLAAERDQLSAERDRLAAERDELSTERDQFAVERDQLVTERDRLAAERDELSTERDQFAVERDQLVTERDQLAVERDQLTVERDEIEARRVEHERTAQIMAKQRRALAQERDELARQMETASVRAASAESMRTQADEMQTQLRADLETTNTRYEATLSECAELQKALHEAELKISELANRQLEESVEASEQLRTVEAANRELTNELSAMEAKATAAQEELEQAQQVMARMQSEVRFVGQLRSERAKLMTEVAKLRKQTEQIEQTHADQRDTLMAEHAAELDRLRAELTTVRRSLQDQAAAEQAYQEQLTAKDEQLQVALTTQTKLEQTLKELSLNLSQHDDVVGRFDDQIRNLETEKEELTHGLRREKTVVQQLTEELEEARKQLRKMELEVSHLELLRRDHKCVSEELAEAIGHLDVLRKERDGLSATVDSAQQEMMEMDGNASRTQQDLAAQKALSGELREENESLQIELARVRTEKATIERLLEVHAETLQRLRSDSMSIETLLERQAAVQESLQEHADRLRSVALDVSPKSSTPETLAKDKTARRQDHAVEILSFREKPREANPGRIDSVLGLVYDRAPESPDDLKRISGIGIVLEQKLNRLGIYLYEQVMNLSEEAVAELSKLLAFKDRIDRDDWIGQARRLYLSTGSRVA